MPSVIHAQWLLFFEHTILVRGGIVVGDATRCYGRFFGQGIIDAYDVESQYVIIVELLREQSSSVEKDAQSFLDAIAFNWLIAGIDAHAKNYSQLLGKNGVIRLAPLYDLASILPYPNMNLSKVKLAMKVGR
jgi:hypothetical protein